MENTYQGTEGKRNFELRQGIDKDIKGSKKGTLSPKYWSRQRHGRL